jgi:hypothetical protein
MAPGPRRVRAGLELACETRNGRFLSSGARSGRAVATMRAAALRPPIEVLTVLARPSSIDIT